MISKYINKIYKIISYVISILLTIPITLIMCDWIERTYYDNIIIVNRIILDQAWSLLVTLLLLGLGLDISVAIAGIIYNFLTKY